MTYVLSDIHGNLQRFESIMAQINLQPDDTLYKRKWIPSNRTIYDYINRALSRSNDVMIKSSIPKDLKKIKDIANKTQTEMVETKKELDKKIRNIQMVTILTILPVVAFAFTAIYQLGSANTVKKEDIHKLQVQYNELQSKYEELQLDHEELKQKFIEREGVENQNGTKN